MELSNDSAEFIMNYGQLFTSLNTSEKFKIFFLLPPFSN